MISVVVGLVLLRCPITHRSLINQVIDPVQLLHTHTLAYLQEQGGIERRFRSETIVAEEVLDVQVLLELLYRLLIADVQHVHYNYGNEHDTRVYV
jgi:hypothetical protein